MSSSRRTVPKPKPLESSENDPRNPSDLIPSPIPRSPLISIQVPSQIDSGFAKGAGSTPKSRVCGGRERGLGPRVSKGARCLEFDAVEVPCFELNEDPAFWEDHNVQVLIRIRPISSMESALQGFKRCLIQESSQTLSWTGHPEMRFTFDHVACETISQEKLFRVVGLPMVDNCMSGYNSCMFAYGQTGSGKTYTMMGDIHEMSAHLSDDRGITPRIFEYLFTRIREEEEHQSEEKLKYNCKCSFLEIYNEQIMDLLEPSSTNLQLREDIKKGVYVENLKEYEVSYVKDVMVLLLQGPANIKMASTHMNNESSRSHSVFTCVIESRREKDSMTHLRFGRLNLVDLAGSERQKSSGAEGERLKEAANINRSLSTLGLVIMTLVDITNGKNRHVPYRDSRLTFLLQDSLGGNSKTTIIANVSPSLCSASETLSTLKFAQRAKLIQNNAKVNEDASGDVMALQRQIQTLKDQLTILIRHQNIPRPLHCHSPSHKQSTFADLHDDSHASFGGNLVVPSESHLLRREIKQLEESLVGALRREEVAEATVRKLEEEIKHLSRLVHQREDDTQRARTLLRFREEKLRRLELLADDLVTSDGYLMEENFALSNEIQLLKEAIDRNPALTQFALENMRLLEQLRMYQNFYQHGERDMLFAEVSYLRNQLLKVVEGKLLLGNRGATQGDNDKLEELCSGQVDACPETDAKPMRGGDDFRTKIKHYCDCGSSTLFVVEDASRDHHRVQETDEASSVDLALLRVNSGDPFASFEHSYRVPQVSSDQKIGDTIHQFREVQRELSAAKLVIKEMESQLACVIAELDNLKKENKRYLEVIRSIGLEPPFTKQLEDYGQISEVSSSAAKLNHLNAEQTIDCGDITQLTLHATLERMRKELEQARILNRQLSDDCASQLAYDREMERGQEQVEAETAKVILYLQEEIASLKQDYDSKHASNLSLTKHPLFLRTRKEEHNSRLSLLIQENIRLSKLVSARDAEISALSYEWEKAIIDLTTFLIDGCRSLDDTSEYLESVMESFPLRSTYISEHVERAIKLFIEKETLILDLQRGLEDAQKKGLEVKLKLNSLRGATLSITELQQLENDESAKERAHLTKLLNEKSCIIQELESIVKSKEGNVIEAAKLANLATQLIKKLYNTHLTDSLHDGETRLMIQELVSANPQVRNMLSFYDPAKSQVGNFYIHDQIQDVEGNMPNVNLPHSVLSDCTRTQEQGLEEHMYVVEGMSNQVEMANQMITKSKNDLHNNKCTVCQKSEILQLGFDEAMKDAEERTTHANNLLIRFDAVQETMEEAELVLKALLKANEGANQEKDLWKQVSTGLLTDKTALFEEVQRLEASKDTQYENLRVQVHACLIEISGLTSSLQQMQRTTHEEMHVICSNIFSFRLELLKIIGNSRLCLEEMMSEVLEKGFEFFVLYQCHRGALLEQIMYFEIHSNLFQDNSRLMLRSEDILDTNMIPYGLKDQQTLCNAQTSGFSSLGEGREVQNALKINKHPVSVDSPSIMESIIEDERRQLSMKQNWPQERVIQLEKENAELTYDMELLNVMTSELVMCSDKLLDELTLGKELLCVGTFISSDASSSRLCEDLEFSSNAIQGKTVDLLDNENHIQDLEDRGIISIINEVLNDIQCLKAQFVYPGSSKSAQKNHNQLPLDSNVNIQDSSSRPIYAQNPEARMLSITDAKTEVGNQTLQAWNKLTYNLQYLLPLFPPGLHAQTGNRPRNSLMKKSLECLCNMEIKVYRLLEKCSSYGISHAEQDLNDLSPNTELAHKDKLIEGLLFDLRLLQESSSNNKGAKDDLEEIAADYNHLRCELAIRNTQMDKVLKEMEALEAQLAESEAELFSSKSELEQSQEALVMVSDENSKLRVLLEDANFKNSQTEELLEDKMKVIEGLQSEILSFNSSVEGHITSSVEEIINELRKVSNERDNLRTEIVYLNDRLEMANTLADENEAIAVEARQIAEASKIYAEEKEEEIKVLEHSVEELEDTINMLESKVHNMNEEVERHYSIRRGLELEVEALTQRMLTVENAAENLIAEYSNVEGVNSQIPRRLDDRIIQLCEARQCIEDLEMEKSYTAEEIKQYQDHISELVLHSEAQSSLYQEKFKALEAMVSDVKTDPATSNPSCPIVDKTEKTAARMRGSGSPFRCLSSLVHQMNLEKDHELSFARHRIEELEALATNRQKEVCMLTARLVAAESMTHDVIRDLIGVKLDMTNYVNLIDQEQLLNLLQKAQQQSEETIAKEKEILNLKKHIDCLKEERESWIGEINQRKADILAREIRVEGLQQREQLLTVQNERLKIDKANLRRKIAELDEKIKFLIKSRNINDQIEQSAEFKGKSFERASNEELDKRLAQSYKHLPHMRTCTKNKRT